MVSLDKNKTDDPRTWALDPGVARALSAWQKFNGAESKERLDDRVFVEPSGLAVDVEKLAARLRADVSAAGVTRSDLFSTGDNKGQLRAHDLRATFVTLSLATGRSETWVADRTGHTSSVMINRYRRAARTAQELVGGGSSRSIKRCLSWLIAPPLPPSSGGIVPLTQI